MDLEIISFEGVGALRFGMTAGEVRRILAVPFTSQRKWHLDSLPFDAFRQLSIHVYYKRPDICHYVEMGKPARPTFRNRPLIGQPFDKIHEWLGSLDPDARLDGSGGVYLGLGIGLYAPGINKNPSRPIEGVGVFERGYWDEYMHLLQPTPTVSKP